MIERTEVGKTRLKLEFPPIPTPKEITEAEINVFKEAIDMVPFCAKINGRLKIFKDPMLRYSSGESLENFFGATQPKTRKDKSLVMLTIRENAPLEGTNLKSHVLGINTGAEQLKNVYYHECGHVFSFAVLEAAFPEQFFDITIGAEAAYKDEQKNPLHIPFAMLEGWRLREEIFRKKVPDDNVYVKDNPDSRMTLKYTNVSIREHFAELLGLYISNSPALTEQERMFFGKIKRGLDVNPEELAKAIAQDPMMLLRSE